MSQPATPSARDGVFAPLHVEGAVERIVRRLGEAIGSGLLRPGDRLPPEHQLADLLAVAPMTLRQALAILRDAGFVETRRGHNAGSIVASDALARLAAAGRAPSPDELRDLVDWRRAVSGEAAALAAERADAGQRAAIVAAAAGAAAATADDFTAYRLRVLVAQKDWIDTLAMAARIAKDEGHFRADLDTKQFAFEEFTLVYGAMIVHRLELGDPARLNFSVSILGQ